MKQTAIEWLLKQLQESGIPLLKDELEFIEQAKEMEKQQIIDAANLQSSDYRGMPTYNKSGEQYYNETFKNK